MIVAVCAPAIDPKSRSRSIASVLAIIARACEREPAPDLLVLPECCQAAQASGAARQATFRFSAAMATGFVETVARAAKEWGVWIAFGHALHAHRAASAASVLDPDGDAYMRYLHGAAIPGACGGAEVDTWVTRTTPLGRWALRTGSSLGVAPELSVNGAGLAIIPAAGASTQFPIDVLCAAARAADCAVCLAQPRVVHDRDTIEAVGTGAIVDCGGNLLAKNDGACGLIIAELDLPAAPATKTWEELETVD